MATTKKSAAKNDHHVVVRGDRSGVYFGKLAEKSEDGRRVVLQDARLIHFWKGRLSTLDVADAGVGEGSRLSAAVPCVEVTDVLTIMSATEAATKNLVEFNASEPMNDSEDGCGDGSGYGDGSGSGSGAGYGSGYGYGDGTGSGAGAG